MLEKWKSIFKKCTTTGQPTQFKKRKRIMRKLLLIHATGQVVRLVLASSTHAPI